MIMPDACALYCPCSTPFNSLLALSAMNDVNIMINYVYRMVRGVCRMGKIGHSCVRVTKGRLYESRVRDHVIVHLCLNVSISAHNFGCVVYSNAMATMSIIIIIIGVLMKRTE